MRSGETRKRPSGAETTRPHAGPALTGAADPSAQALEAQYYASEEDLMRIMRLVAALEPADRAKVFEYARTFYGSRYPREAL